MPTLVPAATTIANSLVTQFSADVHHAVQQTTIKTKPYVKMKALAGKDLAYDGIGSVDMREVSGLFVPVEFDDPAYNRRQLSNRRFVLSLPIDEKADIEQILSVDSEYRTLVANAITRRFDRLVIEAALASINTGANFGTVVTAAADGVVNVNATTGLNYDFLLEIIENWVNKEVHDQYKNFGLCIDGAGHTALMKEIELVSGDYSRQFYVEKGMIQKAAGIDLLAFGNGLQTQCSQSSLRLTQQTFQVLTKDNISQLLKVACVLVSLKISTSNFMMTLVITTQEF